MGSVGIHTWRAGQGSRAWATGWWPGGGGCHSPYPASLSLSFCLAGFNIFRGQGQECPKEVGSETAFATKAEDGNLG